MLKHSTILLVAGLSAVSLAASAASSANKPGKGEFAPLANPPGITMQPLGVAQGYSLSKESAAGLPHDASSSPTKRG